MYVLSKHDKFYQWYIKFQMGSFISEKKMFTLLCFIGKLVKTISKK